MVDMVKICIDPGHGGAEPGATYNGHIEKVLNLVYANKIYNILKSYNCNVFITRLDDNTVSVGKRSEWIKEFGPDVCISCHFNAGGGAGTEAILSVNAPDYITTLATMIVKDITNTFGLKSRGTYTREASHSKKNKKIDYYGLHRLGSPNVIIVEPLFLDNKGDIELLKSAAFMDKLAMCIAATIISALKLVKKAGKPIPPPPPIVIGRKEKQFIQERCNFSQPEDVWACIDNHHKYPEVVWKKIAAAMGYK